MGRFKNKCSNPLHEQWCDHKSKEQETDFYKLKVPGYAQLKYFKSIAKVNGFPQSRIKYVCVFCIEISESKREFTKYLVCLSNYSLGNAILNYLKSV